MKMAEMAISQYIFIYAVSCCLVVLFFKTKK